MGSAVVSTAPVGVPPTGRQRSPELTSAPNGEWNLLHHLFGETPNRATGTVALPFSNCIVPAQGEGTARSAQWKAVKSGLFSAERMVHPLLEGGIY